jgi:poly(3-hydroxybutyrate) depolymerase
MRHPRFLLALVTAALLVLACVTPAQARSAPAVTASATAGCGSAPTLANGVNTIQSGGRSRSYILRIPEGYDNQHPYRLVIGFHWLGGTATDVATGQTVQRDVWAYYGLLRLAGESTIFVAPQGLNNGWANTGGEDVTFVDDMLRQIESDLCVDTSRRFALGFSYGAAMSYALACARPDVFRAVAVYAGGLLSGCSGGTRPIAYFAAHGLRDNVLSIAGGRSMRDRFVQNNGCTPQNPPEPAQGSLTHVTTSYSGCADGYPVVWAAFDEGHIAAPQDGAPGDSGTRTWLPAETWRFFTQFEGDDEEPGPGTGACTASLRIVNSWPGGFQGEVTVRAGDTAITGWTTSWTWPGAQRITQLWGGVQTGSGADVTVRNESWNGSLAAGASTTFGFTAEGEAATPAIACD